MATMTGIDGSVQIGSYTILDIGSWSLNDTREAKKGAVFGNTSTKVHGMGSRDQSGSITGYLNIDDTTGQVAIETVYKAGEKITDLKLYIDSTNYYAPDTAEDADAGIYITSKPISVTQDEIIEVSFDFQCSGPCNRTS